ncbi:hypothetical protein MMAG44476_20144, partial [Mycolicibacterium mageritense DSM 44476 = CIP 104973]
VLMSYHVLQLGTGDAASYISTRADNPIAASLIEQGATVIHTTDSGDDADHVALAHGSTEPPLTTTEKLILAAVYVAAATSDRGDNPC